MAPRRRGRSMNVGASLSHRSQWHLQFSAHTNKSIEQSSSVANENHVEMIKQEYAECVMRRHAYLLQHQEPFQKWFNEMFEFQKSPRVECPLMKAIIAEGFESPAFQAV